MMSTQVITNFVLFLVIFILSFITEENINIF